MFYNAMKMFFERLLVYLISILMAISEKELRVLIQVNLCFITSSLQLVFSSKRKYFLQLRSPSFALEPSILAACVHGQFSEHHNFGCQNLS